MYLNIFNVGKRHSFMNIESGYKLSGIPYTDTSLKESQ